MAIGWLVAIGLVFDLIGAVSLAVPDLPSRYQDWFKRHTPILKKYVANTEKLNEMGRNHITDIEKLRPIFRELWPAIRRSRDKDPGPFRNIEIEHESRIGKPNNTSHVLEFRSTDGELHFKDEYVFVGRIGSYVDSRYRIGGVLLLSVGVSMQIIAVVC